MDDFNTVSDVQEEVVASPTEQQNDTSEVEVTEAENANVTEEEVAAPRQDAETNAAFAAMRRAKEEAERQLQAAKERFTRLGYTADESGTIAEQIEAESDEAQQLRAELEFYRGEQMKACFEKDLDEIKSSFPEETAGDITELGETFMRLRAEGIDNLTAYRAVAAEKNEKKSPPPEVGRVRSTGGEGRGYYSSDELDKLSTGALLSDEKVYKKAMRSLLHLGN